MQQTFRLPFSSHFLKKFYHTFSRSATQKAPGAYFPRTRKNYRRPNHHQGGYSMVIDKIALTLSIIGALNWGSVGLFGFDCVAFLFGGQTGMLSRVIYTLVGLAGIWCITMLFRETEPMESGGQA
jgi:uncharacterized membrane protein YuzA (DUF378 family)